MSSQTAKFLATKRFHPGSKANRTAVENAEAQLKKQQNDIIQHNYTLDKEREMLEIVGIQSGKHSLAFMYSVPKNIVQEVTHTTSSTLDNDDNCDDQSYKRRKAGGDDWCSRCNIRGHIANSNNCPARNADPNNPFQKRLEGKIKTLGLNPPLNFFFFFLKRSFGFTRMARIAVKKDCFGRSRIGACGNFSTSSGSK